MAQGEYKKRSDKFPVQRKSKSSKKSRPLGPKKGGETEYHDVDQSVRSYSTEPFILHVVLL